MRGAALGDVAEALGFEAFFQAQYPGLVRALYLLTGDQDEAEELAQAASPKHPAAARWPAAAPSTAANTASSAP